MPDIFLQMGVIGFLSRVWIEDSFCVSLFAGGRLTRISATDLTMLDTEVEACATSTCLDNTTLPVPDVSGV